MSIAYFNIFYLIVKLLNVWQFLLFFTEEFGELQKIAISTGSRDGNSKHHQPTFVDVCEIVFDLEIAGFKIVFYYRVV